MQKSTANLKLIGKLIVSPDTSALSMANSADLTTESASFRVEAAIDWPRAISDGIINVDCRRTNFNSRIQI